MDCHFIQKICSHTDIGKERDHNEDHHYSNNELGLYIICDGMGGHAAGEVASELASRSVSCEIEGKRDLILKLKSKINEASSKKEIKKLLLESIEQANDDVYHMAEKDLSKKGMGTTIVVVLIIEEIAFIAHVGDSRCYLKREKELLQLTEDHSFVNELLRKGEISKGDALDHPQANIITRAIGIQETVSADFLTIEMMANDKIFLCTDGLYEYFKDDELSEYLAGPNFDKLCGELISLANERGGKDNITTVLIEMIPDTTFKNKENYVTANRKVEILKKIPLFHKMNYHEINHLLEISSTCDYIKEECIIHEKEASSEMYVLLKGEVGIWRGEVRITTLKAGQFFGEMSLIDKAPRSATVRALANCRILKVKRDDLFQLLTKKPSLGMKLFWSFLQNMNNRLRENDLLVKDFYHGND